MAKELGCMKGKDARRSAYDAKEKGAPGRSLQQLKEDYNPDNY